ncbi:MAG: DUF2834 domain-containing protein [Myxococcales bacterium]|nr:DUF2834 domain-containing protein [Myxococcales bacterium]
MTGKMIGLEVVLTAFLALTGYVIWEHGYLGFFELALANTATMLLSFDLVITLSLATVWMWNDAKERGTSAVPFALVTLTFGAAGPLLYLIFRERAVTQSGALAAG